MLASALALGLFASAARADLAPPRGTKRVGYSFTTTISGDTSSQVVFSYPCGGSDGAPMRVVTALSSGSSVSVGSHEGCQIYVVAKAAYDAWKQDAGANPTAPAEGLVAQAKVCSGNAPIAKHQLADSDPRSFLSDTIDVTVAAGSCTVTTREEKAPAPVASAAPDKKGGCNASGASSFPLFLALPALVLLLKKRRG